MSRSRLSLICMSICACILALPRTIVTAMERAVAFVVSLMPASAEQPAFALDFGNRMVAFAGDCPASPALANSLRHEAGMRRLT